MVQVVIIAVLFIAAVAYLGTLLYKAFQGQSACSTGCGKCGAVDFEKLERQITADRNKIR